MIRLNTVLKGIIFLIVFLNKNAISQTAREVGVEIKSSLNSNQKLTLSWLQQSGSTKYEVFAKSSNGKGWDLLATLSGTDTSYVDTSYSVGTVKEYRVSRTSSNYTGFTGNGYILSGFNVPANPQLGTVLVIIDSNYVLPLKKEINKYLAQIEYEGYKVIRYTAARNAKVSDIKSWIFQQWLSDSNSIKSIFLLGRIPVPYSGNFRPDGHLDHTGAWPADLYYGNFYSSWTDASVNNTQATYSRNYNTPGDGKFDISRVNLTGTSADKIQYQQIPVGRVDLFDMPAFGNDTFLMKRYFKKALAFRTGEMKFENKGLVDDNFGYNNSEAFASGGFRNFSTFTNLDISTQDYRSTLQKERILLSYGCGPGTYTAASGVSSTTDFVNDSLLNPFTLTFGSYYGDWDNQNNFLRAPLASKGWGLMSVWSGRPYWAIHECALGLPLYKSVLTTNNAYNVYNTAAFVSGVHVSLMGDPTLRMFVVDNVRRTYTATNCNQKLELKWKSNQEADTLFLEEYQSQSNSWKVIQKLPPQDTMAVVGLSKGNHLLSLRNLQLMESASGTWWQWGARDTFSVEVDSFPTSRIVGDFRARYCPGNTYKFYDSSSFENGEMSSWESAGYHYDTLSNTTSFSTNYGFGGFTDYLYLHRWSKTGCYRIDTISLEINKNRVEIMASNDSVCSNQDLTLTYSSKLKGVQWLLNSTNESVDSILNLNGKPAGIYNVELIANDLDNCNVKGMDTVVILTAPIKPVIRVLQNTGKVGDTVKLEVLQIADFYEFNWLGNKQLGNNNQLVFVPESTGEVLIDCRLSNFNGCFSDTGVLKLNFMLNDLSSISKSAIRCYPNPVNAGEIISLELPNNSNLDIENSKLICRDFCGRIVADLKIVENSAPFINSVQFKGEFVQLDATIPHNLNGLYLLELNNQVIGKLMVNLKR